MQSSSFIVSEKATNGRGGSARRTATPTALRIVAAELTSQRLGRILRAVCPAAPTDPLTLLATRTIDLRSEFEAQLRAVVRLEEQLRKNRDGRDASGQNLKALLSRVLAEMLANNANIREVLTQIEAETGTMTTAPF